MARIGRSRSLCGMHVFFFFFFFLALKATATATDDVFKEKCLGFKPETQLLQQQDATLTRLEYVEAGTDLALAENEPSCDRAAQAVAVDLCRVALEVPTSGRSGFKFELWLPETWNGRTLATGNGGLDGCIKYEDIAYGAANGFSRYAFGTNNGHDGPSGEAFYQNEDVVIDFSWRALHTSVEIGKELTALFYNDQVGKSYYLGCSLGGRQGIGGALKFPDDFDGVVAGAPAVDFNSLYSWRASFYTITGDAGAPSPAFVPAETWKTTVHDEVLRQCDAIDGVEDGIIEDPVLCHVDVDKLLCDPTTTPTITTAGAAAAATANDGTSTDCLTAAQAETVKAVFADYLWPNGTLLYPRPNPGGELLASDGLYSGHPFQPSADWFRYAVLGEPAWDPASYTRDDARLAVEAKNPADIATWPTAAGLAPFRARGGKILSYHGQQDQQISSLNSARLWTRLASGLRDEDGDDDDDGLGGGGGGGGDGDGDGEEGPDAFYRLFRVPGMNHCAGGPGAWTLGQGGTPPAYAIPFEKGYNVLAAIVEWVERGAAPQEIVGTKFVEDDVAKGVAYRHRHCRYPYRSTYSGQGDPLDVESWRCVNFGPY